SFAKAVGYDRPILHGLCTFGFAARHVIAKFAKDGDPRLFKSIKVRFAEPVFPGETLKTEMWKERDGKIVFVSRVVERDKIVLANAAVELYAEIPKAAPPPAPKAEVRAGSAGGSRAVFGVIKEYVEENRAALIGKVGATFQFQVKGPDSSWVLDLKE